MPLHDPGRASLPASPARRLGREPRPPDMAEGPRVPREGEPPGEPSQPARTEPRPPDMVGRPPCGSPGRASLPASPASRLGRSLALPTWPGARGSPGGRASRRAQPGGSDGASPSRNHAGRFRQRGRRRAGPPDRGADPAAPGGRSGGPGGVRPRAPGIYRAAPPAAAGPGADGRPGPVGVGGESPGPDGGSRPDRRARRAGRLPAPPRDRPGRHGDRLRGRADLAAAAGWR